MSYDVIYMTCYYYGYVARSHRCATGHDVVLLDISNSLKMYRFVNVDRVHSTQSAPGYS